MVPSYFYLKPNVFSVVGFAYGKVEGSTTRGGKVKVKLVQSGRWAEEDDQSIDLVETDISPRAVTTEEAEDGAGTFVGGVICTSRVRPGGARVWDYGLVKWDSEQQKGSLDVNFDGTESSIVYNHSSTQDVSVEIYALQPCGGGSTSLLMFQEMKQ
ncbi:LOW QUALITY PROTEIN: hypothetical protein PHMEG_00040733 [Phytophthora megakarya]|uniref:Uncharacterized protein n=1 Tax=Phytophthora megakarya TaxID=4795 RepID=A0A225UD82_9STRA|nr:LOW QUALITY PROTEIN: hypothetical protein PHMEG_00040733 [Phytophthora megakarya]